MERNQNARRWFIRTAVAFLGTPYIWGGDDPSGFDCSGYVIECLKSVGFVRESKDYTADGLLQLFKEKVTEHPEEGCLLFFLDECGKAKHVTICLDEQFQIGASGGGSATRSAERAYKENAYVKIRPIDIESGRMKVVRLF